MDDFDRLSANDDSDSNYSYDDREDDGSHSFDDNRQRRDLIAMLDNQRETGEYTDVVVEVAGEKFPCHRAVLVSSLYFKTMLSCKLTESNSKVIKLHGIDATIFSKILSFLYTGKINISKDNVQDILQAAHMLQIDAIQRYCLMVFRENLCPSNCLDVMRFAELYELSDLKKKGWEMAVSQFLEVRENEACLTLSTEELLDLLKDKNLQIFNEDDVVDFVIRWLDYDTQGRKTAMSMIMQEIHLSCVKVSTLSKLESHPVIQEFAECLDQVTAAKEKHLSGTKCEGAGDDTDRDGHRTGSGISDELAIIVGGWKPTDRAEQWFNMWLFYSRTSLMPVMPIQSIICLDPDRKQCYQVTDLPTPVSGYMSVASVGRHLYITGGRVHPLFGQGPHSAPSRQAFRYNFFTDTWTQLPNMPRGRAEHQSLVADEKLFLIGGDVEQGVGRSILDIDYYDLHQGVWIQVPQMPLPDTDSWNFTVTTGCYEDEDDYDEIRIPTHTWNFTVKALHGKIVVMEVVSCKVGQPEADPYIDIPRVHAFDIDTGCWTSATTEIKLPDGLEHVDGNTTILSTAVDDRLCFVNHGSPKQFAYDVKDNILITTGLVFDVVCRENIFIPSCNLGYLSNEKKDIIDTMVMTNRLRARSWDSHLSIMISISTRLPFALFGHSYVGCKKTSVGWYCRDLEKVGREH